MVLPISLRKLAEVMSEQSWVQVNSPYALCCAVSRVFVVGRGRGEEMYPAALACTTLLNNTISTCNDGDGGSENTALESAHEQSEREFQ